MIHIRKSFLSIIVIFFLITIHSFSQEIFYKDSLGIKYIKTAKEIMVKAGNCALITIDEEGGSRARTMDPFAPEEDLTVWFGTNPKSRKVNQIKNDPRVTLYYFDQSAVGYVMIQGTAELINDKKLKIKYWKEHWTAFYPDNDENYLLIKVSPIWLEVVSYKHGIEGDPIYWIPPVIDLNSDKE
jgi:general stress protein 26